MLDLTVISNHYLIVAIVLCDKQMIDFSVLELK